MTLFIGIDGGGTGCRAVVADAAGTILGRAESGPANVATDLPGALQSILACARAALQAATGSDADLPRAIAGLGLAGANAAGAPARLRAALPFARARIETDAVTAAKGALGTSDGILAALGTGSVFAVQRGGFLRQYGGWGFVLGDEGSGARLGRSALSLALRAVDGLTPMTPLLSGFLARLGGPEGIVAFSLAARPAEFAALAPEILKSDDPAAQLLFAKSVSDVAEILSALQPDPPLPVTFTGGLGAIHAAALADRWPQRPAQGTALDGALLLAREAA